MDKTIFQRLGLSSPESDIYLALLKEPSTMAELSRRTGIRRASLYSLVPTLQNRTLIRSFTRGKREYWVAEPPVKLMQLVEINRREIESLIPELEQAYRGSELQPIVQFLHGREGIQYVFHDIVDTLPKGGIYYRFRPAASSNMEDSYITPRYRQVRKEKQLQRFWITNDQTAKAATKQLDRHMRIVPEGSDIFAYNLNLTIYGNKIAYIDYNTESVVIIENKQIAEFQKHVFTMLFKSLKSTV